MPRQSRAALPVGPMPIEDRARAAHVPDAGTPPSTHWFRVIVEHVVSAETMDDALAAARRNEGVAIAATRLDGQVTP